MCERPAPQHTPPAKRRARVRTQARSAPDQRRPVPAGCRFGEVCAPLRGRSDLAGIKRCRSEGGAASHGPPLVLLGGQGRARHLAHRSTIVESVVGAASRLFPNKNLRVPEHRAAVLFVNVERPDETPQNLSAGERPQFTRKVTSRSGLSQGLRFFTDLRVTAPRHLFIPYPMSLFGRSSKSVTSLLQVRERKNSFQGKALFLPHLWGEIDMGTRFGVSRHIGH